MQAGMSKDTATAWEILESIKIETAKGKEQKKERNDRYILQDDLKILEQF